jgi:hypothetical protein
MASLTGGFPPNGRSTEPNLLTANIRASGRSA